uniref:Uncharacterized protein LOC105056453 isoform X3 n=1 Tax=Elaeis guineensis var. tenera TaxID=51953 RepID=A0A6I9S348_ELAGV|nr:uncharacterized protein LOC105056453 isoform X3 [Elaeis guineensis]
MALRLSSAPLAALSLPPSLSPSRLEAGRLFFSIRRPLVRCYSSKKKETSFTDRILDYIEGGPKLRKWYGAPDRLPKDGGLEVENESSEIEEVRDAVLVTDGESEIGQMVILSLILKRARVKALVKDKQAAVDAFGGYVEPMAGDINDRSFLTKALRGVRAIICPSNDGFFSDIGQMKGVQHIVLLSQGVAAKGKLSKEDAAVICVEALDAVPQRGLVFEVVNGEEKVPDWKEWFAALIKSTEELQ